MSAIEVSDETEELNLAMNWEKAEPSTVAGMLTEFRKATRKKKNSLVKWTMKGNGKKLLDHIDSSAITEETRGPFVTELVERFSDLGSEKQLDLLPEQAKVRLSRLQEIILLKPDDSVVPRETQMVFAANHLVRAWFPEESRRTDACLLSEVRRSVSDAQRNASEKPRLWRAVWRIAIRRPVTEETATSAQLDDADDAAIGC
jgi:hypothetical protein